MFQKAKQEKKKKENRKNLKMFPSLLQSEYPLLASIYSSSTYIDQLRIATVMEFNYIISTYIELINKLSHHENFNTTISDIKVGIIGGGIIGRLFLNSLLVFQKQGLNPHNVYLSTRQTEDFEHYVENFGLNVMFDNEKIVEESDIIIITVPSTLDNWVIVDLKQSFEKRIKSTKPFDIQPLVFITTSNMVAKKNERIFHFPILVPTIRGQEIEFLKELSEIKEIEEFQQKIKEKIASKEQGLKLIQSLIFAVQKVFSKTFQSNVTEQTNKKSLKQIESSVVPSSHQEQMEKVEVVNEVISLQQNAENTFLVRCRKWRMAYHNFIS